MQVNTHSWFRSFLTFKLPAEVPVTAPGANQHRCSGILVLHRPIDREGWLGDVVNQPRWLGDLDLLAARLRRHVELFFADIASLIRGPARPNLDDRRLVSPNCRSYYAQAGA
jgi:hypothetical protein